MLTRFTPLLTPARGVLALWGRQMHFTVTTLPLADDQDHNQCLDLKFSDTKDHPQIPHSSEQLCSLVSALCCKQCEGDEQNILDQHLEDHQCSMNQSPSENVSRFSCGDGRKAHGGKKKKNQTKQQDQIQLLLCKLDCFDFVNSILGNDIEKLAAG